MRPVFLTCFLATSLTACHAEDPRLTGLYAAARDIVPVSSARLAACLARDMPPSVRERAAPDGSWRQFSDGPPEQRSWALRLTRLGADQTEIEIDSNLRDGSRAEALGRAAAACAGR